jgi:hypothetical protein
MLCQLCFLAVRKKSRRVYIPFRGQHLIPNGGKHFVVLSNAAAFPFATVLSGKLIASKITTDSGIDFAAELKNGLLLTEAYVFYLQAFVFIGS